MLFCFAHVEKNNLNSEPNELLQEEVIQGDRKVTPYFMYDGFAHQYIFFTREDPSYINYSSFSITLYKNIAFNIHSSVCARRHTYR